MSSLPGRRNTQKARVAVFSTLGPLYIAEVISRVRSNFFFNYFYSNSLPRNFILNRTQFFTAFFENTETELYTTQTSSILIVHNKFFATCNCFSSFRSLTVYTQLFMAVIDNGFVQCQTFV